MFKYCTGSTEKKSDNSVKALVINSKRNGLAIIRSLGAKGVEIIAVDHFKDAIGLYSKYVSVKEIVPLITDDEFAFVLAIVDIAKRRGNGKKIILFPSSDAHLMVFVRFWQFLEPYFYPTFEINEEILNRCLDKTKVEELARASKVPIPKTLVSPPEGNRSQNISFPLVVKPDIRSSPKAILAKIFRLKVCENEFAVEQAASELEVKGFNFVIQEYIPGGDEELYTVGLFAEKGEIRGMFTCRKLRQFPPIFGECSYGEIIKVPILFKYANYLIKEANFTGIAQIEFKKHKDDYYLIEINPRTWSWVSLSKVAGIDIPWLAYLNVVSDEKISVIQKRWTGKWSYLSEDLKADSKRLKPTGKFTIIWQSLKADSHSIWSLSDPIPGVIQLVVDIKKYLNVESN